MVAAVIDDTGLEFEMLSAILLSGRDYPVIYIKVIQRSGSVGQALVPRMPGLHIPVGDSTCPSPFAFSEVSLEAGHDAEYVAFHEVEAQSVVGNHIDLRDILG